MYTDDGHAVRHYSKSIPLDLWLDILAIYAISIVSVEFTTSACPSHAHRGMDL